MEYREVDEETVRGSVRYAAERLDEVANGAVPEESWYAEAKAAIRDAISAVESHLGSIAADNGLGAEIRANHQRLVSSLEQHEAAMAHLLVELWDIRDETPRANDGYIHELRELARRANASAEYEVTVLYESFDEPTAVD